MDYLATVVLSNHRPETVLPAKALMTAYDTIILEEPPDEHFQGMLSGALGIAPYLETLDLEYPAFSRLMSETLRACHAAGKKVIQVEPFLKKLLAIHDLFAEGGGPSDLEAGTALHAVYAAERNATAALLDFYKVSVDGPFEAIVEAVKRFARVDAQRFVLRDGMRAGALVPFLKVPGTYFIEAGQIHYILWRELKRRLPPGYSLTVKFLMADAARTLGYRGHLYGPGDLLTLHHIFHPGRSSREEDLLASRALIYNKLIAKEEITQDTVSYPHTRDELENAATVRRLSPEDCHRLFPLLRRASTDRARDVVRHYLIKKGDRPGIS